ncbi:hypothetical protein V6N13_036065 [Hibiscus sabdariffa]
MTTMGQIPVGGGSVSGEGVGASRVQLVNGSGSASKASHAVENEVVERLEFASSERVVPVSGTLNPKTHTVVRVLADGRAKGPSVGRNQRKLCRGWYFETEGEATETGEWIGEMDNNLLQNGKLLVSSTAVEQVEISVNPGSSPSPNKSKRSSLWTQLEALRPSGDVAWLLGGDFNAIASSSERMGGSARRDGISVDFNDFLQRAGLNDLGFHGARYTWKRGTLHQRLDRCLGSDAWWWLWPQSHVLHLNRVGSDHRPLLLETDPAAHSPQRSAFRYLAAWQEHQDFEPLLFRVWSLNDPIVRNISNFQAAVSVWNKESFGHIGRRKRTLMARINGIERVNEDSSVPQFQDLEQELKSELSDVLKQEELLWFQRARTEWINDGDRNTKFYHRAAKARHRSISAWPFAGEFASLEDEVMESLVCNIRKDEQQHRPSACSVASFVLDSGGWDIEALRAVLPEAVVEHFQPVKYVVSIEQIIRFDSSCSYDREMENNKQGWLLLVETLLILNLPYSLAFWGNENKINTAVFLSPKFVLGPGSVKNRFYYNVDFPRGHIALKSFNAEVIDEAGNPVPLHETYLHHWAVGRYFVRKGVEISEFDDHAKLNKSGYMFVRNSGICQDESVVQLFGLGSETRKTATHIPDPYGIEVGNPAEIPSEFVEQWLLNIHAMDTRGAEDKLGCTECRCDLYNVTADEYGRPLRPDYIGGLSCCYDHTRCKVKQGFESVRRTLYLRYTVKWVDMDSSVLPVKVYIFDITDTWKRTRTSTGINAEHQCKVEYDIEPCHATRLADDGCIDTRRIRLDMPFGGYLIYGVAHQHSWGTGSALYREDGRLMCSSLPTYGEGEEAGNEAGYIVGMTTCYPQPGAIKISRGETLILESNYSRITHHTGVMGLFYILVADQLPKPMHTLHTVIQTQDSVTLIAILWAVVAMIGVVAVIAVAIHYRFKRGGEDGYEAIGM